MDNKNLYDARGPFMVCLQDTEACVVMLVSLVDPSLPNTFQHDWFGSSIKGLFPET